jgi:hypothetical protein
MGGLGFVYRVMAAETEQVIEGLLVEAGLALGVAAEDVGVLGSFEELFEERVAGRDAELEVEGGHFQGFGAPLAPEGGGHLVNEPELDGVGGAVAVEVGVEQGLVLGRVLAGDDHGF